MDELLWISVPKKRTRIAPSSYLEEMSSNIHGGSTQEQKILQWKNYYSTVQFQLQTRTSFAETIKTLSGNPNIMV